MEIVINIGIAIVSLLVGWYITHLYYKKSSKDIGIINKNAAGSLYEQRMQEAISADKRKGTPKDVIDTFDDMSVEEKAKMYDDVIWRKKGRPGKNNPYKI